MKMTEKEAEWYDQVRIEIRAVHCPADPAKNFYQVMRVHPRECLTQFMSREQTIKFCEKEKLKIIKIIDNKDDL